MYNKVAISILVLCLAISNAQSQPLVSKSVLKFNRERKNIGTASMSVLGGYALGNMVACIPNAINLSGRDKYFNEMNVYWNVVNLGIAIGGLIGNDRKDFESLDLATTLKEQKQTLKIYGINAGLDVVYIGSGLALMNFAHRAPKAEDRLYAYGESILLQGGFLLLYDSAMLIIHAAHLKKAQKREGGLSFSERGMGLKYEF